MTAAYTGLQHFQVILDRSHVGEDDMQAATELAARLELSCQGGRAGSLPSGWDGDWRRDAADAP